MKTSPDRQLLSHLKLLDNIDADDVRKLAFIMTELRLAYYQGLCDGRLKEEKYKDIYDYVGSVDN